MPDGLVVVTDQRIALELVARATAAEPWRCDRRTTADAVLAALVHAADWTSGLITGMTRAHLAAAAGCSPRTVTAVLRWAEDRGLLLRVEQGASAAFLGSSRNRAATFAVLGPVPEPVAHEATCYLPPVGVGQESPRRDRGRELRHQDDRPSSRWGSRDRADTAAERDRATTTLLERTGLAGRVPRWRAAAFLAGWWRAGACVAGVLHAIDHHPDQPDQLRGDALRSARDPLAVLGYRLRPWQHRLSDLPPSRHSVDRAERLARVRALELEAATPPLRTREVLSSPEGRAAARALFAESQAARRRHTA